uniref:Uncharacterized protein n=1 Tax=Rhizophora mucronata TaxID=61149 RepID=A0A2P2MLE7_RHIMU
MKFSFAYFLLFVYRQMLQGLMDMRGQ